jgi:NADH dehydrogenase
VRIRLAELQQVIPAENKIVTEGEEIEYDVLVLSTGADTNFFGKEGIKANAFPMKSTVEALQLRNRLLKNLEEATDPEDE